MINTRTEVICEKCGCTATVEGNSTHAGMAFLHMGWSLNDGHEMCPECSREDKACAIADIQARLGVCVLDLKAKKADLKNSRYWRDLYWDDAESDNTDAVAEAIGSIEKAMEACLAANNALGKRLEELDAEDGSEEESE